MPVIHQDQRGIMHAILSFIISALIGLIAVKYQGKLNSPFDTRPVTTFLSIFFLLLYCSLTLPLVARLPAFNTARGARTFGFLMILSFYLSIALLTSLLFQGLSLFLLSLPLLILLSAAHLHGLFQKLLHLVKQNFQAVVRVYLVCRQLHGRRAPLLLPLTVADTHFMSEL